MHFSPGAAFLSFIYDVGLDLTASITLRFQPFNNDVLLSNC